MIPNNIWEEQFRQKTSHHQETMADPSSGKEHRSWFLVVSCGKFINCLGRSMYINCIIWVVDVPSKPQPIRIPGSPSPEEVYLGWQHHPAILHLFCRRWRTFFSQRKWIIFQPSIFKGMLIPPFKKWDPYMGYMNPLGWRLTSWFPYYMDMHITGWWFQIYFWNFHPENWGRFPFWLIFFNWVETTN